MHIIFDARFITDHFPGIGRYSYHLLRALQRVGPELQMSMLYNPGQPNTRYDLGLLIAQGIHPIPMYATAFSPATQLLIPRLLRQHRADVYHAPYYVRPYFAIPCRSVTTLYDMIPRHFPNLVSRRAALLFDGLHRLAIRSSDAIITLSQHAAAEFAAAYALPTHKIHVTAPGIGNEFRPQDTSYIDGLRKRLGLRQPYVLSLASNKPHKNIETLLHAWSLLVRQGLLHNYQLVIAGHWDARYPQAQELTQELGLGQNICFLANVSESDMPGLYAAAELFVFPSLYEGFGLPPLEAMACGTPVMCGSHSSLPEVVGAVAHLVDVGNAQELATAIQQLLSDAPKRKNMAVAGLQQAARFSWEQCARETLGVYQR